MTLLLAIVFITVPVALLSAAIPPALMWLTQLGALVVSLGNGFLPRAAAAFLGALGADKSKGPVVVIYFLLTVGLFLAASW